MYDRVLETNEALIQVDVAYGKIHIMKHNPKCDNPQIQELAQ